MTFDFPRWQPTHFRLAPSLKKKFGFFAAAKRLVVIPAILTAAGLAIAQTAGPVQTTDLVSVSSGGYGGALNFPYNSLSAHAGISADGRFIAFDSFAFNLVQNDTNGQPDVFVHDYQTGVTERVSVDSNGQEASSGALIARISTDGRYVAFGSASPNLLPNGSNNNFTYHAFIRDRQSGTTEVIDVDDAGTLGNMDSYVTSVSEDGRYVAFVSYSDNLVAGDTNGSTDIFVHDRQTGVTERINVSSSGEQANYESSGGAMSTDGRFVAFISNATNLVPDDTNGVEDVFVRDRLEGTTTRVNVNNAGEQALHTPPDTNLPGTYSNVDISADGRFVVFDSPATNLDPADTDENFDVFVHDRLTGTTELVSVDNSGLPAGGGQPFINADGRFVVFGSGGQIVPGVTEGIYVRDRISGTTELISVDNSGTPISSGLAPRTIPINANGQFIAFGAYSTQLVPGSEEFPNVQVFVRNRGPQDGQTPSVSAGGPYSVALGDSVTLSATGFDPNGDPLTYAWDFDNDGVFETAGQSVDFPTTGFSDSAIYNVRVRVTDAGGLTGLASAVVAIAAGDAAPTVAAGGPYSVNEGGTVTLTASGSDPNGDPLTYAWDLDANGTFETSGQSVTFSAAGLDGPTSRGVFVKVTDPGELTAIAAATIVVNNAAPTADAGGPYVVNEGSALTVSATGADASPADAASLTYAWDLDDNGSFETPGQSVAFSAAAIDGPAIVSIRVQVSDKDGGVSVDTATISVANAAPVANAGGPYTVDEGGSITLAASATDVATDPLMYIWDLDNNGTFETPGQSVAFSAATLDGPAAPTVRVRVTDDDGGVAVASATVTVNNVAPTVSAITAPIDPMPIGTVFNVSASYTDPAEADTHTATWYWGGKFIDGVINGGTVTGSDSLSGASVYEARLTMVDDDGGQGVSKFWYLVAYDPSIGGATGGGTIASPAGGYFADPTVSGPAQLGFFARAPKGIGTPSGIVRFRFEAAGFEFRSTGLTSMTIDRARTTITGRGDLNGQTYLFRLNILDGDAKGGGGVDRFRIKIYTALTVAYDSEPGAADDADPVTALQSGSIIVQRTGAKGS